MTIDAMQQLNNCQRQRCEELSLVEQNTGNFGTQRNDLVTH